MCSKSNNFFKESKHKIIMTMKKSFLLIAIIFFVFPLTSICAEEYFEFPGNNHITSEDAKQIIAVHNTTTNPFIVPGVGGRIGDPFPSYWDGMWHVYALRKGLDVVLHFTSTDLVVWNEHKPAMVGRGIATGTVVRHDNKFYMFYTDAEPQTIRLVISENPWYFDFSKSVLIAEADGKVYTLEKEKFRDCYVFYYEKENLWWMLVEATSQGKVAVGLFKSEDLLNWTQQDPIFMDPLRGHGSCPQLIEKEGRWYLPMLDYPTWYYVADDPYGPWELGGFYHTKRMSAASRWDTDSKRWLGWGFFTTDDTPEGDIDWEDYGPMCVGRELVFNKDGGLGVRPIPELVEAIRESKDHAYLYACARIRSGKWIIDPNKKQLRSTDDQSGSLIFDLPEKNPNYYFEADVELSTPQTKVDIVVRTSEGFDSGYRISVEPNRKVAAIRHFTSYDGVFDEMPHVSDDGKSFHVKAFIYDGIIEVFVDGRTALSTRVAERSNYRVAIDVSGGQATISNPLFHYFK
jgi:beta-fructofuranosidase